MAVFPSVQRRVWALMALVLAVLVRSPAASAQVDLEPTVATPDGRYRVALDGDQVILYDNVLARVLIGGASAPISVYTPLHPSVRMTPKAGGMDLVFTYVNDTPDAVPLGWISFAGVRLPSACKRWVFSQDTTVQTVPNFSFYADVRYPQEGYSPVTVIGDDRHTLGFSIQYPIVEYGHNVLCTLAGVQTGSFGQPSQTWTVQFKFEGTIPAGATRTYTVSIRVTPANRSFLYTLTPYREYFRSLYGPVDYNRDARPVTGISIAQIAAISTDNPRGFQNPQARPDVVGWAPTVNHLLASKNFGYRRTMCWTPSGCQAQSTGLNYPYRFMTAINDLPVARNSMSEFLRVKAGGVELGFWWGNNATLMRGWNETAVAEGFDPDNPEHVQLAYAELDMAVAAGATTIGLDAFKQRDPAKMFRWLQMMKEHAPNVKFCTENGAPDLIHNLAPTFHEAEGIRNPHILADFLNPGHETWAAISSTPESRAANRNATNAEILREVNRVAALGFVPLIYARPTIRTNQMAAESWLRSIPRDLQMPTQSSARLIQQQRIRRAGGGG